MQKRTEMKLERISDGLFKPLVGVDLRRVAAGALSFRQSGDQIVVTIDN